MKIDPEDPNLTAHALDELAEPERSRIEAALAESPEARADVEETLQLARMLQKEFRHELEQSARKPAGIMPLPEERSFWSDARWASLGLAALLAICGIVAVVILAGRKSQPSGQVADLPPVQMEVEAAGLRRSDPATEQTGRIGRWPRDQEGETQFVSVADQPRSALPLQADTECYAEIRRWIESGTVPPKEGIWIDGMINYFSYDDPPPKADEKFSLTVEAATCPWQPQHWLVRVRVQGRDALHAAELAEIDFNRARISSYRLIGYEQRRGEHSSSVPARPAKTVTILYELVPTPTEASVAPVIAADKLFTVHLRARTPEGSTTALLERSVSEEPKDFSQASHDLRFAAAVAEFGMLLRKSPHRGVGTFAAVAEWAENAKGRDPGGERAQFVELVRRAETLPF